MDSIFNFLHTYWIFNSKLYKMKFTDVKDGVTTAEDYGIL